MSPTSVPEPEKEDRSLRAPSKVQDKVVSKKYRCCETFTRNQFKGNIRDMGYILASKPRTGGAARNHRSLSSRCPTHSTTEQEPVVRKLGGPSAAHCELYGLDETSHPMDWLNSILPMTPIDNLYDAKEPNVKADNKTKFAVSN